jgi:hypothetical protein
MQTLTIGLPIAAGVVGYFIVFYNNWRLERRKAELKFVSDQLQYLYGPLFALSEAGRRAAQSLLKRHGLQKYYFEPDRTTYSSEDINEYRLWMSALIPFPNEFYDHVREMFDELKARQARLIGLIGRG